MKIFAFSGLGADERIFQYLNLEHELIPVKWIRPYKKESIVDYSKRLISTSGINDEIEFGILGVSFGGLIATEVSKLVKPKFTILISSVETKDELSGLLRLIGKSKIIDFIPKEFFNFPKFISQFMFGAKNKELLKAILNDTDLYFTKWAIREMLNWENEIKMPNAIKISGSKDKLLSLKGDNSIIIDKGEHFMIVDKALEISKIITKNKKTFAS